MALGVINRVGVDDFPVGANHDTHAGRPFLVGGLRRAIGHRDGFIGIAKQIARQPDFVAPFLQIFRRTEGNPQNDGIFIGKVLGSITEPGDLLCSIVAERAWIEPQHDMLPGVVRQADILPVLVGQSNSRRHAPDFR